LEIHNGHQTVIVETKPVLKTNCAVVSSYRDNTILQHNFNIIIDSQWLPISYLINCAIVFIYFCTSSDSAPKSCSYLSICILVNAYTTHRYSFSTCITVSLILSLLRINGIKWFYTAVDSMVVVIYIVCKCISI